MIEGVASGLLMASFFVCAAVLMLFAIVKDPPSGWRPILEKLSPGRLTMSIVLLAYPAWGVIGLVMGLLYQISRVQLPGPGMGSPNVAFTLGVILVALAMAAPFFILLKRLIVGVLTITLSFIATFGWFLPYFSG